MKLIYSVQERSTSDGHGGEKRRSKGNLVLQGSHSPRCLAYMSSTFAELASMKGLSEDLWRLASWTRLKLPPYDYSMLIFNIRNCGKPGMNWTSSQLGAYTLASAIQRSHKAESLENA